MSPAERRAAGAPAPRPWYRQVWPWLLMLMPALAVVGGLVTFWLAATTSDPLVVDDYYREGKAINRQLARDDAARALGLNGVLARSGDGVELRLSGRLAPFPAFLTLRLVHATRAELDMDATVALVGNGVYRTDRIALPASGRWNVQIEDPDRSWRLTAAASGFEEPLHLGSK